MENIKTQPDRTFLTGLVLALGTGLYALPPYLYARFSDNYFFNTAIHFGPNSQGLAENLRLALTHTYYPPFYFSLLQVLVNGLGFSYAAATTASTLFVLLCALFLWRLGRLLFSGSVGVAAAVAFLLMPGTALILSSTIRDAPLALFSVATIYYLLKSNGLRRSGFAAAAGLMTGLGLLTKWVFPLYILGFAPLVLAAMYRPAWVSIQDDKPSKGRPWMGATIYVAVALGVAGWWYAHFLQWDVLFTTAANDPNLAIYSFGEMLKLSAGFLAWSQLRWVWLIPAALGVVSLFAIKTNRAAAISLGLAVLAGLLILALPRHTEQRYYFAFLPWVAMLSALVLAWAKKPLVRGAFWVLILAIGLGGYLDTFFGGRLAAKADPLKNMLGTCDQFEDRGRLPWQIDRGSLALVQGVRDHYLPRYAGTWGRVVIPDFSPQTCQLQPHALRIINHRLGDAPNLEFVAFDSRSVPHYKAGEPYYFPIRQHLDPQAIDLNLETPQVFYSILDGKPVRRTSFEDKLAFCNLARQRLPLLATLNMMQVGDVDLYVLIDGHSAFTPENSSEPK